MSISVKQRILAIDDVPANLLTLSAALADEFALQIASSGAAGLALARKSPPDLILLDVMMPDMDGFETCRRLRAEPGLADIPVVFITAMQDIETEMEGLTLGAADYIIKPINVKIARQRIRNLIERENLRKQVQVQRDMLEAQVRERNKAAENFEQLSLDFIAFLENTQDFLYLKDANGRLRFCSQTLADVTGHASWRDMVGKHDSEVFPPETAQIYMNEEIPVLRDGAVLLNRIDPYFDARGKPGWVSTSKWPLRDSLGAVVGLLGISRDVTESILSDQQRKRDEAVFHGLFDQSIFLAGVLDPQGRIVEINNMALEVISARREDVLGQYFPDTAWWQEPQERERLLLALASAQAGKAASFEASHFRHDGEVIAVAFSAMPILLDDGNRVAVVGVDITQRMRVQQALQQSERRFRKLFEANSSVMWLVDPVTMTIVDLNTSAARFYGYTREQMLGMPVATINTLDPAQLASEIENAARESRNYFQFRHRLASGELRDVDVHSTPIDSDGRRLLLSIIHDVTERKQALAALFASEEKHRLLVENSHDLIYTLTGAGVFTFVSPAWTSLLGHPLDEAVGQSLLRFIHPQDAPSFEAVMKEVVRSGRRQEGVEYRVQDAQGRWHWHSSNVVLIRGRDGQALGVEGSAKDITERRQMEDSIRQLAFYDELTALPNRRMLMDRLRIAMATGKRSGAFGALMFLDLDNFKPLNDQHGHEAGDSLLKAAAQRMRDCVREVDTIARFGGDEFVLMLGELDADPQRARVQAEQVAQKVLSALARPYVVLVQRHDQPDATVEHRCSASIGLVMFNGYERGPQEILQHADAAMYLAKQAGRNQIRFSTGPASGP